MSKSKAKCLQCREKPKLRGCCFTCYQRVRRAIIAGTIKEGEAVTRGLILGAGKHGRRSVYAKR
jgi:hypothetical protein